MMRREHSIVRRLARSPLALVVFSTLVISSSARAQSNDYVVGAQDILTITVWDEPELTGKYTVEADGTFTFPMIGRIKGGGLTLRAVEAELKKRLADGYFKNPQLSVAVETYRSQRIFIVGEVRTPGAYPLTGQMTLIEALALAGSASREAAGHAVIVRGSAVRAQAAPQADDAPSEVLHVELKELENGSLTHNVALKDGDTIFVPRAETVYVSGQVKSPGAYAVQKDTTVLQALALAGGVSDRGSTSRIRIIRLVNGKRTELKVGLGDPVQGGDTIIVLERFF